MKTIKNLMKKEMTITDFINVLSKSFTKKERDALEICVGSDEGLTRIYKDIKILPITQISLNKKTKNKKYVVIYGVEGSEIAIN